MSKHYQSPDLYIENRTNFFQQVKTLCGSFIGYIQMNEDGTFLACPIGKREQIFIDQDIAIKYVFGAFKLPDIEVITPEIAEYHSRVAKLQLSLF
jgi:hypothetical protein